MTEMDGFYERVIRAKDPNRLFPVRSNKWFEFYAGRLVKDDFQALIGLTPEHSMLLLTFANHGALYDIERVKLPEFDRPPEEQYLLVNNDEFHEFLSREYSFEPAIVRVKQFLVSDEGCEFSVGPLAWHHERFLVNPEDEGPPEEQDRCRQLIIDFLDRSEGVLDWGNEWYVLDADGMSSK